MFKQIIGAGALAASLPVAAPYFTSYTSEEVETGIDSLIGRVQSGEVRENLESRFGEITIANFTESAKSVYDRLAERNPEDENPFAAPHPGFDFGEFKEGSHNHGKSCLNSETRNFDPLKGGC